MYAIVVVYLSSHACVSHYSSAGESVYANQPVRVKNFSPCYRADQADFLFKGQFIVVSYVIYMHILDIINSTAEKELIMHT